MKCSHFFANLSSIFGFISGDVHKKYLVVLIIFEDQDSFALLLKNIFFFGLRVWMLNF